MALSILINLTFCSLNACIYLADILCITKSVLKHFEEYPDDVAWLLNHLLCDGNSALISTLINERFLGRACLCLSKNIESICRLSYLFIERLEAEDL